MPEAAKAETRQKYKLEFRNIMSIDDRITVAVSGKNTQQNCKH